MGEFSRVGRFALHVGMAVHGRNRERLGVLRELQSGRFALLVDDGTLVWLPATTMVTCRRSRLTIRLNRHELPLFALPGSVA